jgi:8-oxo-dGTP pyrophosphatase MutT (NUDIX family)
MHRNKILSLLNNYFPIDANEKIYKKEIINFILNNSFCFERSNLKGHITASGWLINKTKDQVLLLHHKKLNEWYQLGGHADGENDLIKVAIKEAQEESGINNIIIIEENIFDIDIHLIPKYNDTPEHKHYDIRFLLQVDSNEKEQKNEESIDLKWFFKNFKDFPNKKESMLRMFSKWINIK